MHDIHVKEQLGYESMKYVVLVITCLSEVKVGWTGSGTACLVLEETFIPLRRILEVTEDVEENGLEGRPSILIDSTSISGVAEDPDSAVDDL